MKILYIGETWLGSNARAMRDAFMRKPDLEMDDIGIDRIVPTHSSPLLRAANRMLRPLQKSELTKIILQRVQDIRPDFVVVYKVDHLCQSTVRSLKAKGAKAVLLLPDYSPHAFGESFKRTVGEYDLVCSTKPFHPALWKSTYGYSNKCAFVPHGYNPMLHLRNKPAEQQPFDVVLIANGRPEYYELMRSVARRMSSRDLRVAICGPNWADRSVGLPNDWVLGGEKAGISYVEWLRKGKIVLAPLNTRVVINGVVQPGDVDTSRTYNIPAAHCFVIHRRTDFVKTVFDEETEMAMYGDADELADKIDYFLSRHELRSRMASAAHARAVPACSLDARATQILTCMGEL